jgi:hypothetical protein
MIQEWWNDIVRWFASDDGWAVVTGAILPFLAILAAGIVAGLIARGSTKRLLAQHDRQHKAAAVAALISAGRRFATWNALPATEQEHLEHQSTEASVRVRLLPEPGADLAADWAEHYFSAMRRNSANFSFQAEQDYANLRDGLVAWQAHPRKARKLFGQDLAAWKYESSAEDDVLVARQQEWAEQQRDEQETAVLPAASR